MRKAARAIILKDDHILVMHRNKFGQEYDVLVGGGVDIGESTEEALLREIQEETGVAVSRPKLVFVENAGEPYGVQYIYLCNYVSGELVLDPNSIEAKIDAMGINRYVPMWRKLEDLNDLPFKSEALKQAILEGVKNGFSDQPIDITINQ
jgi:ADP-ribose pyrophosphatase YjhB (NUDIX family)